VAARLAAYNSLVKATSEATSGGRPDILVAWCASLYLLMYLAYLFWHQESELLHWGTLVLLPLTCLIVISWLLNRPWNLTHVLAKVGLKRGNLIRGLWWAGLLGVLLSLGQISLSRNWPAVQEVFASGKWTYMLPLSFALMLLTAGFTEEFFFRGFLLGRLLDARLRTWLAILCSAAAFAVYHLPYAYFNPNWPSAGNWTAALTQSFIEAFPVGILLGLVFVWSRRNLLACAVLHALINTLPAMALIKFGG